MINSRKHCFCERFLEFQHMTRKCVMHHGSWLERFTILGVFEAAPNKILHSFGFEVVSYLRPDLLLNLVLIQDFQCMSSALKYFRSF